MGAGPDRSRTVRTGTARRHYLLWSGIVCRALWPHGLPIGHGSPANVAPRLMGATTGPSGAGRL